MKVKNTQIWFDQKDKVSREPKDEPYVMSKERFEEVNGTRFGVLVEEIIEVKKETPKKKK